MSARSRAIAGIALACGVLAPAAARANAGLPMLVLALPLMTGALLPVVAVEAWVLAPALGLGLRVAARLSLVANLVSTFVGVPLTWLGLMVLQMGTGGGSS